MQILPLRNDLIEFLKKRNLIKKWPKVKSLFENDIRYPSLNVELMRPRWRGIYSFRIDNKYRALFFISENKVEVFQITNHYKK